MAAVGRLRVAEPLAVEMIQAAGTGTVLTLLGMPPERRDVGLADAMFDAVMRTILTDAPVVVDDGPTAAAVAFRTVVPALSMLSDAERALLSQWLDRVIARPDGPRARE